MAIFSNHTYQSLRVGNLNASEILNVNAKAPIFFSGSGLLSTLIARALTQKEQIHVRLFNAYFFLSGSITVDIQRLFKLMFVNSLTNRLWAEINQNCHINILPN